MHACVSVSKRCSINFDQSNGFNPKCERHTSRGIPCYCVISQEKHTYTQTQYTILCSLLHEKSSHNLNPWIEARRKRFGSLKTLKDLFSSRRWNAAFSCHGKLINLSILIFKKSSFDSTHPPATKIICIIES